MSIKTSLRIIKKSLSSKKRSAKRTLNKKELEMAVNIQQVIKDNEEREKNKVYQQQINKAMKEIREKKKKSVLKKQNPYDNKMISEIIDLSYEGNYSKCYNMFNLAEYFCCNELSNKNVSKTLEIIAYKCGFDKSDIKGKNKDDLCNMIIHSYQSPNILSHLYYNLGFTLGSIFNWSSSSVVKRLRFIIIKHILEGCPFIYNSIFKETDMSSIRTKAYWVMNSSQDLYILNYYIDIVKTWADLGRPSFFEKLIQLKKPRTGVSFGRITNQERKVMKRMYEILLYIKQKVMEHKTHLESDYKILKEIESIREEIRRRNEEIERMRRERRKEEKNERRHQEHMNILKNINNLNNVDNANSIFSDDEPFVSGLNLSLKLF